MTTTVTSAQKPAATVASIRVQIVAENATRAEVVQAATEGAGESFDSLYGATVYDSENVLVRAGATGLRGTFRVMLHRD